jgi:hypothetical protein
MSTYTLPHSCVPSACPGGSPLGATPGPYNIPGRGFPGSRDLRRVLCADLSYKVLACAHGSLMNVIGVTIRIGLLHNLSLFHFLFLSWDFHLDGDDGGQMPDPLKVAVSDHLVFVLFQPERLG